MSIESYIDALRLGYGRVLEASPEWEVSVEQHIAILRAKVLPPVTARAFGAGWGPIPEDLEGFDYR